ncbi:RNA polymerase sigma factor SigB [Maioricimonas rarisocia]|uniref:RNA polymerase sigma factor SigB n=1 Tax=Maioricimonas rarisocia TaxID=2528026 RepID=A0A517Z8Y7_9PLAN|nr:sigma-70 family RNA polymerase sigma factor [Maioricimonas rarisocia]QDU38933.1 RNA polymerase sigma factor SigB [Maioricimonas rarisocia]
MSVSSPVADSPRAELRTRARNLHEQSISFIHNRKFARLSPEEARTAPDAMYQSDGDSGARSTASSRQRGNYWAELARSPLLTPEGEFHLFQKMNFLKYQASRLKSQLSKTRPRRNIVEQIEALLDEAEATRNEIARANLRLVVALARKFSHSSNEFEELLSDGNMILMNAVEKFDCSRGFRFSTYATHAVQRHFYRQMQRRQRRRSFEIATSSEVLVETSVDSPVEDELEQVAQHKVATTLISRLEDCLDERELYIMQRRFGLGEADDDSGQTLKTLAGEMGLSKERVRQLQIRAIEKVQDLAMSMNLTIAAH